MDMHVEYILMTVMLEYIGTRKMSTYLRIRQNFGGQNFRSTNFFLRTLTHYFGSFLCLKILPGDVFSEISINHNPFLSLFSTIHEQVLLSVQAVALPAVIGSFKKFSPPHHETLRALSSSFSILEMKSMATYFTLM